MKLKRTCLPGVNWEGTLIEPKDQILLFAALTFGAGNS